MTYQNDNAVFQTLSDLTVRLYPEHPACSRCAKKTALLKTDRKTCYSFDLGKFTLISGCNFCANHKYRSDASNQIIRYESNLVAMIVDKGYQVTFDLVVKVGRLRYDDHRQLHEIQAYLKCSAARIELPLSTIGVIAKRFLEFCQLLHQSREADILEDIRANGGYVLHFDGSTEQQCGLCSLVLIDSRSGHVLESLMVPSEKYDTIKDTLGKVQVKYGSPLAVISDLRPGFVRACTAVFGDGVNHILCHYHFLRTLRDELAPDHQFIKLCMTQKWQLQAGLAKALKLLKEVKPKSGYPKQLKTVGEIEAYLDDTGDILGAYRYALRWILSFKQDSTGKGVPFDLPYRDLYRRFVAGKDLIDRMFSKASPAMRFKYYHQGFCQVVNKTNNLGRREPGFWQALRQLEFAHRWFNKLRAVLFLEADKANEKPLAPLSKKYGLTEREARKIPQRLDGFLQSLQRELAACRHPARRAFLENLQNQVRKHQGNLQVPVIVVISNGQESPLVLPRTNNALEALFRFIKSLLRRCSGRSKLPKEFGSVGALLPYYMSMRDHPTFRETFNNDRQLAEEFAKLFVHPRQGQSPQNTLATLSNTPTVAPVPATPDALAA